MIHHFEDFEFSIIQHISIDRDGFYGSPGQPVGICIVIDGIMIFPVFFTYQLVWDIVHQQAGGGLQTLLHMLASTGRERPSKTV